MRRAIASNANNIQRNLSSYVPFAFDVYHREGRRAIDDSGGVVRVDSGVDNTTPVDIQFRAARNNEICRWRGEWWLMSRTQVRMSCRATEAAHVYMHAVLEKFDDRMS